MRLIGAVKKTYEHHKDHLLTVAFVLGFVVDNITLNRVDQLFDNLILSTYVTLAMLSLLALYAGTADKLPGRLSPFAKKYAPLLTQYAFGGLLSGMLIFYGRSGSWFVSWPFLLIILGVIFGNETIRDRVQRFIFNISILFVGLFSYIVLVIPVITGTMGAWVFVGSGMIALMIMYLFMRLLGLVVPRFIEIHQRALVFTIGSIYMLMNFLYFANVIPPIPLSLKDIGIYHSVVKFDNDQYQLKYESPEWWQFGVHSDTVFHSEQGDNIFCFASVFAPARLATDIYYRWERYDEISKEWVQTARIPYPISGGRGRGYRSYTFIQNYTNGDWRCTVETARGQVIGSIKFSVASGSRKELVTHVE